MRIEYLPDDPRTILEVAGWLYGEWGHLSRGNTLEKAIRRISRRAEARTIPLTLIVRDHGAPVGTASLVAHDMKTRLNLTPWLASVYVVPSHRRRGFGAALCRRVVREAKRLGYGRIYLFTPDKAEFYKALEWKEIQRVKYRKQKVTMMAFG
jgi:GNAT superfamily N-acetyltransferase